MFEIKLYQKTRLTRSDVLWSQLATSTTMINVSLKFCTNLFDSEILEKQTTIRKWQVRKMKQGWNLKLQSYNKFEYHSNYLNQECVGWFPATKNFLLQI
jgi:hypothetical protein